MTGTALVDTNILVYRFDPRFPEKQARATAALYRGLSHDIVAHLWAYAEHFGLAELWSEDFQHDRIYGTVRAVNPLLDSGSRSARHDQARPARPFAPCIIT